MYVPNHSNCPLYLFHLTLSKAHPVSVYERRMMHDPANSDLDGLQTVGSRLFIEISHCGVEVFGAEKAMCSFTKGSGIVKAGSGMGIVSEVACQEAGCEGPMGKWATSFGFV